jgi:hypothetical protein
MNSMSLKRFSDRITNFFRGTHHSHRCSIHNRSFDPQFFKRCPVCIKEEGPFYLNPESSSQKTINNKTGAERKL